MLGCTYRLFGGLFQRLSIVSDDDAGNDYTMSQIRPLAVTMPTPTRKNSARPSVWSRSKSLRNSYNRPWVEEQQRQAYLHHLAQWSLDHDSSPIFHGKISLLPSRPGVRETFELGKSVRCMLIDATVTNARHKIIIRLYPPQTSTKRNRGTPTPSTRRDSMDPLSSTSPGLQRNPGWKQCSPFTEQGISRTHGSHYKLVVRCGAGWMSARDYFNRIHFSHSQARRTDSKDNERPESVTNGSPTTDKDSVIVRPLFRYFRMLPPELQEMILDTAAGLSRSYNLCGDEYGIPQVEKNPNRAPISLSTLFRISKGLNEHLVPHVYHRTDFHFGLTGYSTPAMSFIVLILNSTQVHEFPMAVRTHEPT